MNKPSLIGLMNKLNKMYIMKIMIIFMRTYWEYSFWSWLSQVSQVLILWGKFISVILISRQSKSFSNTFKYIERKCKGGSRNFERRVQTTSSFGRKGSIKILEKSTIKCEETTTLVWMRRGESGPIRPWNMENWTVPHILTYSINIISEP